MIHVLFSKSISKAFLLPQIRGKITGWLRQKSRCFMIPFANSDKRGVNIAPATRTISLWAEDTAFNELTISPDRLGNKRWAPRRPSRHFSRTQQLDCPRSHANEILKLLFEAEDLLDS